jgi:hypothetical protein
VFPFKRGDVVLVEPHWNLDGDCCRIVCDHEPLKLGVALVVAGNCRQYEGGRLCRCVLLVNDDELVECEKIRRKLRAAATMLVLKQIVRTRLGN